MDYFDCTYGDCSAVGGRVILGSSHHDANQILADNANEIKSKLLRMHLVPAITK